jgi:hypothetical protein
MAKKSKAKGAKKRAKQTGKEKAQTAGKSGPAESGSKFQSAFAKIAPPKGFAIKRP